MCLVNPKYLLTIGKHGAASWVKLLGGCCYPCRLTCPPAKTLL